jgi:hypothetical protein
VLFATNYPMISHDQTLASIDDLGLHDDTRVSNLHSNVECVFNLGKTEVENSLRQPGTDTKRARMASTSRPMRSDAWTASIWLTITTR